MSRCNLSAGQCFITEITTHTKIHDYDSLSFKCIESVLIFVEFYSIIFKLLYKPIGFLCIMQMQGSEESTWERATTMF